MSTFINPTKCFTFWCRLDWRKNNLNLASTENQLFLCCVWLSKASIDIVWLSQALIDEFFRSQKCETIGRELRLATICQYLNKCFTFCCRLVWQKNNLDLALTEKNCFRVVFDSLKLGSTSFDSLKLRLTNFSGHQNGSCFQHFWASKFPTDPFTTLELQNQSRNVSQLHKIRRSPDLEAQKFWKGRSG